MTDSVPNHSDRTTGDSPNLDPIVDSNLAEPVPIQQDNPSQPSLQDAASLTGAPAMAHQPGRQGSAPLQQLDRRWIGLVRGLESMTWGVLGIAVLITGLILLMIAPPELQLVVIGVWLLLAAVALVRIVWWPRWVYAQWSYRVGQKVFELRHGLLWTVSVSIPLSRLQHVDLHRGPLERRYGLASLQIHTAGTKEASQLIPGLDFEVAQALRDRLIDEANRVGRGGNESTAS